MTVLSDTLFSTVAVSRIYADALRVLSEVGIQCDHRRTLDLLSQKSRISVRSGRVLIPAEEVDTHFQERKAEIIRDMREAEKDTDPREFRLGGSWNCIEYCDPVTNLPRPATLEESVRMAKLAEALGAKGGTIPVSPGATDPRLRTLQSEKIALLHTRTMGGWLTATDREEISVIAAMHAAAGRRYTLGLEGLISPLKLNSEVMDTWFDWRDSSELDIGIMGGIPVAGTTAPMVFPANFVLSVAEALALDWIMDTLSDGRHTVFNIRLDPFDMRSANLLFGSAEWCIVSKAVRDLIRGLFGMAGRGGAFRTNGKRVDAQTVMERTASFLWQALLGSRVFGAVGQLCIDEVYSPVQAVLDRELVRYGARLLKGIPDSCWQPEIDAVALIREGVAENGFMAVDSTNSLYRDFYDLTRLASAENLNTWRRGGSKSMEAAAWDEAQELIRGHDFELEGPARREVERLYERGAVLVARAN
jgi:trimethylamine:corrinoid methyltransferase-like protein